MPGEFDKLSGVAVEMRSGTAVLHWPSERARQWVQGFVHAAREDACTHAVVLLGSVVRGVREAQDADVVHIFHGQKMQVPGRSLDVDLWSYRAEDVEGLVAGGNDVLGWAIKFGLLLHEKDGYWTRLRAEWQNRLPLPSVEVARKRAQRAGEAYAELRKIGDLDAADEERLTQLTHLARARLLSHGVYPASRPELPGQLRRIGDIQSARTLSNALRRRSRRSRSVVSG